MQYSEICFSIQYHTDSYSCNEFILIDYEIPSCEYTTTDLSTFLLMDME